MVSFSKPVIFGLGRYLSSVSIVLYVITGNCSNFEQHLSFIIGFANEVLSRDHKALAVERELKHGAEFGFGMPFAFLNGSGIEIVERDQAMGNVGFALEFELGLL